MSNVTNAILTWEVCEPEGDASPLVQVNALLAEEDVNRRQGFVSIEDAGDGWYGGSKMMEHNIALAAFNYVNTEQILSVLRRVSWAYPEHVRLMTCEQEENAFSIYALKPEYLKEIY